jgi:hypothetical protein
MAENRIDVEKLLARVDIIDLIDKHVPLTNRGAEHEACCPFHAESTPSFKVSAAKQMYHCFGCGANGNAIGFLINFKGLSFLDACAELGGDAVSNSVPAGSAPVKLPAREKESRTPWVPVMPVPEGAPPPPRAHVARGMPEKTWCYRSADGAAMGWVYRFTKSDGGKETLPLVWARNSETNKEEWRWMGFGDAGRPLYGLDRLAAKPDAVVLVVEGEKCADAGHEHLPEFAVVSWQGGGKAVDKSAWLPLTGRKVLTWADCDAKRERLTPTEREAGVTQESKPLLPEAEQPGRQAMDAVARQVRALGGQVRDVIIPAPGEVANGWDIADAVAEGMGEAELVAFMRSGMRVPAVLVEPVPALAPGDPAGDAVGNLEPPSYATEEIPLPSVPAGRAVKSSKPLLIDAVAWLDDSTPFEWVVDGLIQRGCLYAMTAVTNHGKTAIGLLMAMCVASAQRFAGREVVRGKVLILCGENPDGFRTRLRATMQALDLDREDVAGLVTVLPHALPLREYVEQIKEEGERFGEFALVLVDTSVSYFTGDSEDDNLQARSHAWDLRELAALPGHPAVIANCHPTKSANKDTLVPRGGGAFTNEIDTNLTVWSDGETAHLHWHLKKRGPDFDPIPFEFHGKSMEEHGQKVPTVVALPITDERAHALKKGRNQDEDRLLYAMLHHPDSNFADWATACGWNGERAKSKVHRVMARLLEDKLVEKSRKGFGLSARGKTEAQAVH